MAPRQRESRNLILTLLLPSLQERHVFFFHRIYYTTISLQIPTMPMERNVHFCRLIYQILYTLWHHSRIINFHRVGATSCHWRRRSTSCPNTNLTQSVSSLVSFLQQPCNNPCRSIMLIQRRRELLPRLGQLLPQRMCLECKGVPFILEGC